MPKLARAENPVVAPDENERTLEFWFRATVSREFCERYRPFDLLFVLDVASQKDKVMIGSLTDSDSLPQPFSFCLFRRDVTITTSLVQQLVNEPQKLTLYGRNQQSVDGDSCTAPRSAKTSSKRERPRKVEDLSPDENTEELLSVSFDFMELITGLSATVPIPSTGCEGIRDCYLEIRCSVPLLPPVKLEKYRPLRIEVRSINRLAGSLGKDSPLCVTVNFGEITFRSPKFNVKSDGKVKFRRLVFLGNRTPLEVYNDLFFKKMSISLLSDGKIHVGSGSFSLREMVTEQQTKFNENVYLLPNRATSSLCGNCVVEGTFVSLRLDFFIPLPLIRHIRADGQAASGQFLTCGVIRMPYRTEWTENVLDTFISTLLQFEKPTLSSDVYQREPVVAEPQAPPPKEKKQETKSQRSQPAPPPRPPSPSAFVEPFEVVTPPGISGFEVMDGGRRIIGVEGPVSEIQKLFERLKVAAGHCPQLELLMNPELFVPKRRYLVFPSLVTLPVPSGLDPLLPIAATPVLCPVAAVGEGGISPPNFSAGMTDVKDVSGAQVGEGKEGLNEGFDSAEAEDNGTGGRIHRIRIRETIDVLISRQRHLLKRNLSELCINCYTKLHSIFSCTSLRDVVERDLFPTPEELLALERSFGATLELADVFGRDIFANVPKENEMEDLTCEELKVEGARGVDLTSLREEDVGQIVIFEAFLKTKRKVPAHVRECFPHASWLHVLDSGRDVLCAFRTAAQIKATINYRVEAQIVRSNDVLILYALSCESHARICIDSHNLAYEARLAASRKPKRLYFSSNKRRSLTRKAASPRSGSAHAELSHSSDGGALTDVETSDVVLSAKCGLSSREVNSLTDCRGHGARPALGRMPSLTTRRQYELCWEIYRQRAPPDSPDLPTKPQMRF
ncbi:hypothetical protein TRVL_02885 [Trypanosoma vivax]|nr:hypothetical protein TRVL_02885 [Trypanosoma vivax]